MKASDILGEFSIKIYEPPLQDIRESGEICNLSNPLSVAMLIVDFDTEVCMQGILDFLGNSTCRYVKETILALKLIGCEHDSTLLQKILEIATAAGMTHDAIQSDRARVEL